MPPENVAFHPSARVLLILSSRSSQLSASMRAKSETGISSCQLQFQDGRDSPEGDTVYGALTSLPPHWSVFPVIRRDVSLMSGSWTAKAEIEVSGMSVGSSCAYLQSCKRDFGR